MTTPRAAALLVLAGMLAALAVASGTASSQDACMALEDFAKAKVGEFPADWKPRKDAGREVYAVREESGLRFLRAVARGTGIQAARQIDGWNLTTHPVLAWSWRPREFPKGADERESSTNDSALAVYMFVPYSKIAGPKAVKYIWSEKVPVGTHLSSNVGLTQVHVLRSGTAGKDRWTEERVNVLADYKRLFGVSETPTPAGIGVLTDSDDTKSNAQGDYAKLRACRG
jgi:hypothetical protein